jgi:peptidoglycan L-alanyl-D-glutamate endopeptidase CwlK
MITYNADPLFWQRFLKSASYYAADLDGDFGVQSNLAASKFEADAAQIAQQVTTFDTGTESNILTLHVKVQKTARQFMVAIREKLGSDSLVLKIICATRTYAEQIALYAQGRSTPGPIVTNVPCGATTHNFGLAWDIGVFQANIYVAQSPIYAQAGAIGKGLGLEWGGDWQTMRDESHFQCANEDDLASIRAKFEAGEPII